MKIPKRVKRYCPHCKMHTEMKVSQAKRKQASPFSRGSKIRARKRGAARGMGNLGRYSRKAVSQFKMTGKKLTKKTDLRFTCTVCGKTWTQRKGLRIRKVELV